MDLYWILVVFQAQFKVLVITYKALYNSGQGYLKDCLIVNLSGRPLQSSGEGPLPTMSHQSETQLGTWERACSVIAPQLWNCLPLEVQQTIIASDCLKRPEDIFAFVCDILFTSAFIVFFFVY